MIPPVIDSDHNVSVSFAALPTAEELRRRHQSATVSNPSNDNASQLRPKIAQIGHDKVDSDDEGDSVTTEALLLQERVKLEKLLCKQHSRVIAFILVSIYVIFLSC